MAARYALLSMADGVHIFKVCAEDVGSGCAYSMHCACVRTDEGPLRLDLGRYPSERLANEALQPLLEAWGEAPGDRRPATRQGRPGDGFTAVCKLAPCGPAPAQGVLFITEDEVPF